jgi:hypothetical protein
MKMKLSLRPAQGSSTDATAVRNDAATLTTAGLAARLGLRSQTLRRWRLRGCGPRFIRLGNGRSGRVLYRLSDITGWMDAHAFNSTSEEAQAAGPQRSEGVEP